MTPLGQLEVRAGEIRIRVSELANETELTDETRAELDTLRTEYADTERKLVALRITDAPPAPLTTRTGEGREFREMLRRGNVGDIFHAAIHGGVTDGATSELQKHFGLETRQVPLAMLIRRFPADGEEMENRAATAAPGEVQQNAQPVLNYVFPDSMAVFMSIDMPSVPAGDAVFPILTNAPTVGTPAEHAEQAETDGTFSADVLTPRRVQAAYSYSHEDRARFPQMDAALRESLSEGISDALDKELLVGTGGLLAATNLDNHNVSTVTTYALYRSQFAYGRVDGRYASMAADLRVVMGAGTYAHAAAQYRGNNDNMDALMSLQDATGGVRVSAHVTDVASSKQNAVIRLGMRRDMVQAVWSGVTIIPDEVTRAAFGEIKITALGLFAQKILRKDGFHKQQTQHA